MIRVVKLAERALRNEKLFAERARVTFKQWCCSIACASDDRFSAGSGRVDLVVVIIQGIHSSNYEISLFLLLTLLMGCDSCDSEMSSRLANGQR
jgi:hypothetical protein